MRLGRFDVVSVIGPGDVYVFSGANPHMAIVTGDSLSVASYARSLSFPGHILSQKLHFESRNKQHACALMLLPSVDTAIAPVDTNRS